MIRSQNSNNIILHLLIIVMISYYVSLNSKRTYILKKTERFLPDMRHILLWNDVHDFSGTGQDIFLKHQCQDINCFFTSNKSMFGNLGFFDAILFGVQGVSARSSTLPDLRSPSQKYIFAANDSADNFPICDPVYDHFFNWTWTYRVDSTLPYKFITIHNKEDQKLDEEFHWILKMEPIDAYTKSKLETKSKAAAIFMDKCTSRSKREVYIQNLQKHLSKYNLSVDIFGECGPKKCKRKTMGACFWRLRNQYFFYLAMEDSFSPQYITREVLIGYQNNAIPIVYGGAEYARILPPLSYLDATHLNEEMLAKAMHDIMTNKTLLHLMFRWRNHYFIKETPVLNPCELCRALNNPHWMDVPTTQHDFREWWNLFYKDRCKTDWMSRFNGF